MDVTECLPENDETRLHPQLRPRRLSLYVDARLQRDCVPPGGGWGAMAPGCYPEASFDFYPFCGVQRSVLMCVRPRLGLEGLQLKVHLDRPDEHAQTAAFAYISLRLLLSMPALIRTGVVAVSLQHVPRRSSREKTLPDEFPPIVEHTLVESSDDRVATVARVRLRVPRPRLWSPDAPELYSLRVELSCDGASDEYEQLVGLRTVEVEGSQLLLNGRPLKLNGFGRHEDFPLVGRGDCGPVLVRDHACLRWVGANSYRTAHYPYSEVDLELADAEGFLVLSEAPTVGLSFHDAPEVLRARQLQSLRALRELIARDRCRACVVAWSVCNEPGGPKSVPTAEAKLQQTAALVQLVETAKGEGSRPVTFANIPEHCDEANAACDFLCLNEYAGWYYDVGKPLVEIGRELEAKLTKIHERFTKPILVSECGADTLAGCHMMAPGLWSEEFQAQLLETYATLAAQHEWMLGVHVWNLCDFRTPQMHIRAGGINHKGVFTRLREPKMAAHRLRKLWSSSKGQVREVINNSDPQQS